MEMPNLEGPVNTNTAGTVDEGAQLSLTGQLVSSDADSPNTALVYTLLSLPEDGALKLGDTDLTVGGTFTQKDVIDGKVNYIHAGRPDPGDSFDWELTDGVHKVAQTTFAITVTPTNDAPVIVNNMTVDVAEGAINVLTADQFSTSDEENGTMTYTLVSTVRGALQLRVGAGPWNTIAPGETFTPQDIADGNVRFVDPGTDDAMLQIQQNTTASFSWRVNDGEGGVAPSAAGAFVTNFNITSVDDQPVFTWRTSHCAGVGQNVTFSPLVSLTDADNTAAQYSVCVVSIGTGWTIGTGGTATQLPLVVQNNVTNLAVNSCVPANALSQINVDSNAGTQAYGPHYESVNRGTVQWRLMLGTTQFGAVGATTLPVSIPSPTSVPALLCP
jgi:VCBS repeat-containing protein